MGGLFVILGIVGLIFLLFFPFYLEANFYYNSKDKKIGVVVYVLKKIKIIGGYLDAYPGGIALHTSNDKAILFPIQDKEGRKKRISIFRRFKMSRFAVTTETGAKYLPLVALLYVLFRGYFVWQGGEIKNYQSHVWLKDGDCFSLTASGEAKVTIYMQICALINKIKEKLL